MNSLNHYAYGAIGQWMYERIAGLSALEPGYKTIRIAPQPQEPLTSAEARVNTPYGKASSSWRLENGTFSLDVVIPPNTTAQIHLPKTSKQDAFVNGKVLDESSPFKLIEKDDKSIVLAVHAGKYQFQTKLTSDE
jgi:alpha-L-rhamnosidase